MKKRIFLLTLVFFAACGQTNANITKWNILNQQTSEAATIGDFFKCIDLSSSAIEFATQHFGDESEFALSSSADKAHCLEATGNFVEALKLYERILVLANQNWGDEHEVSIHALNALGLMYSELDNDELSIQLLMRGINASEKLFGSQDNRTSTLRNNLGLTFLKNRNLADAERLFSELLKRRSEKLGPDHPDTLTTKQNLASVYQLQRRYTEARLLFTDVLDARRFRLPAYHPDLIASLNNLASSYSSLGQHSSAEKLLLEAYEKASENQDEQSPLVARAAGNLAVFYRYMNNGEKSQYFLLEALQKSNAAFGPDNSYTLNHANNLAALYLAAGLLPDAERIVARILNMAQDERSAPHILALTRLSLIELLNGNPDFALELSLDPYFHSRSNELLDLDTKNFVEAIHYNNLGNTGKLSAAITGLKIQKNDIEKLEEFIPDSISIASKRKHDSNRFSELMTYLLATDRVAESELIGRLSKYRQENTAPNLTIPLTPLERDWEAKLATMHEANLDREEITLEIYTRRMNAWLEEVAATPDDEIRADWNSFGTSLQDDVISELAALGEEIGMLQIASLETQTHFFVLTPNGKFQHHSIPTGETEIADLIFQVRDELGLHDPDRSSRDTLPGTPSISRRVSKKDAQDTLQKLYGFLMPDEVIDMLNVAKTDHLILNLQGRIRYAPFAALYDGEKYLTEKFSLSRFTWGDLTYEAPEGLLSNAAGFGMSEKAQIGEQKFKALPGVDTELKSIFGTTGTGILPGAPQLNKDFTRATLVEAMAKSPSVLHISSHFDMRPGDEAGDSYLLLGDGTPLTLKEINASTDLSFEGVDLLVLSACSTARSTDGTGIEVEGLGAIAQLKGADAVIATLWNVADNSTSKFMTNFYAQLQQPNIDKSQAVRNIQRAFINGEIAAEDPGKDYSHPYYWAPFILMGNWK